MRVSAPGKLILSGEHAVVYGYPALAMAVDRYVDIELTQQTSPDISFHFAELNYQRHLPISELEKLRSRLRRQYELFQAGSLGVRDILSEPVELLQFAMSLLLEEYQYSLSSGLSFRVTSTIPIGCGMGSSAAMILGVLVALARYCRWEISEQTYYQLGLAAENMQHGRSSGMDLVTSWRGGCIYRHAENIINRPIPNVTMYLVNTGKPIVSTGECVAKVAPYFKNSTIGEDFAVVTNALNTLLSGHSIAAIKEAICANHALLNTIGVVPPRVNAFIHDIESHEGAAKICGAGAVAGEQAGMVLVFIDDEHLLHHINLKYGYSILPIQCVSRGVHVI